MGHLREAYGIAKPSKVEPRNRTILEIVSTDPADDAVDCTDKLNEWAKSLDARNTTSVKCPGCGTEIIKVAEGGVVGVVDSHVCNITQGRRGG